MSQPPTELFLEARPYYDRAHVEEIAAHAEREGIPFCKECSDFHLPDEEHSEIG